MPREKIGKYMVAETTRGGWIISNKRSGDVLGYLEYYKPWKEWIFGGEEGAEFSVSCLRDIAALLERLNKEGPRVTTSTA